MNELGKYYCMNWYTCSCVSGMLKNSECVYRVTCEGEYLGEKCTWTCMWMCMRMCGYMNVAMSNRDENNIVFATIFILIFILILKLALFRLSCAWLTSMCIGMYVRGRGYGCLGVGDEMVDVMEELGDICELGVGLGIGGVKTCVTVRGGGVVQTLKRKTLFFFFFFFPFFDFFV